MVTDNSLNTLWQDGLSQLEEQNLVVFGFNGMGLVSYKKELIGQTEYFQDLAKLSKQLNTTIICGTDTDTYGVFRHSAVVADRGRILGVSDSVHTIDESEFVSGGNYSVYQTSAGKIGVIVAEDIFFAESSKHLSMCGADFIVCIIKKLENFMPITLIKANSFMNGVATALVAQEYASVANSQGKIISAAKSDLLKVKVNIDKEYHIISSRRRGISVEKTSPY